MRLRTILLGFWTIVLVVLAVWQGLPQLMSTCSNSGDYALLALQIDRASEFQQFVGPYSRFRFNHPSPFLLYWYAFIGMLTPDTFDPVNAARIATLILSVGLIGTATYITFYLFSPLAALLLILGTSFLPTSLPSPVLTDIWGPNTLPCAALLFLIAGTDVAFKRTRYLWAFALGGVLLVGTHLGTLPFVSCITFSILLSILLRKTATFEWHRGSIWGAAGIVGFALFFPIFDAINAGGGNITRILAFLGRPALYRELSQILPVLTSLFDISWDGATISGIILLGVSIPIVSIHLFWIKRSPHAMFALLIITALLGSLLAAIKVRGPIFQYLFTYLWAVRALLPLAVCGWIFIRFKNRFATLLSILLLIPLTFLASLQLEFPVCADKFSVAEIIETLPLEKGTEYRVVPSADWALMASAAYELKKRGYSFCVDRNWTFLFDVTNQCATPTPPTLIIYKRRDRILFPRTDLIEMNGLWYFLDKSGDLWQRSKQRQKS